MTSLVGALCARRLVDTREVRLHRRVRCHRDARAQRMCWRVGGPAAGQRGAEPVEVRVITVGPASTGAWDPAQQLEDRFTIAAS